MTLRFNKIHGVGGWPGLVSAMRQTTRHGSDGEDVTSNIPKCVGNSLRLLVLSACAVAVAGCGMGSITNGIGGGMFAIGDTKVRPRLGDRFSRDEKMGIYLQVYNFLPDEKTQKPNGEIAYEISKVGATEKVLEFSEDVSKIPNASANQVTIEKLLPLKNLTPGAYTLKVKATDRKGNQTLQQQTNFTVN